MKLLPRGFFRATPALVLAFALGACSTTAPRPAELDKARSAVDHAQSTPTVSAYAGAELKDAVDTYRRAESLFRKDGDTTEVRNLAHLARQRAAAARETAERREAEQKAAPATSGQQGMKAEARSAEATAAGRDAQLASMQAEAARSAQAPAEVPAPAPAPAQTQDQAEAARRQAVLSQQSAEYARLRARGAQPRNEWIDAELRELYAAKSERGTVITMNDVLFDAGSAGLRPGGVRLVARIATLLREYPERTIAIEGFTDSVGDDAINKALSERRADAVRAALMDAGIQGNRIVTRGYGAAFPVASNDTAEGRQRNRRVEVVIGSGNAVAPRVASSHPVAPGSRQ